MLVREAYRSVTHSVCRPHYDGRLPLPQHAPVLGPVVDARYVRACEFCSRSGKYYVAPAGEPNDPYIAGYDGNVFDTAAEAAAAIPELRRIGPDWDHDWVVRQY